MTNDRAVTLVLVTPDGSLLGSLPPIRVPSPWWQEAAPIIREAKRAHDVDVTILRLLGSEHDRPPGGRVTYLAEVPYPVPTAPWSGTLDDHQLRLPWARPGGPTADLAWATTKLARTGRVLSGAPEQIRTWSLSSIWRLPAAGGDAWLKCVPPFFGHEGRVIDFLAGFSVPRLIAHDRGRLLAETIRGDDLYDASGRRLEDMVSLLVDLQARMVDRVDGLLEMGLPDWRTVPLTIAIESVIERTQHELAASDIDTLRAFQAGLADRFAALADRGLPATLVHGDFHPGNLRGERGTLTLLDWGDCGIGHPLLDQAAFLDRIPAASVEPVQAYWLAQWLKAIPGADPRRAAELIRPLSAVRLAVVYRTFLDGIEPSEHPYHRTDPAEWLRRTAAIVRAEQS